MIGPYKLLTSTTETITDDHDGDPVIISNVRCMLDRRRETNEDDRRDEADGIAVYPDDNT